MTTTAIVLYVLGVYMYWLSSESTALAARTHKFTNDKYVNLNATRFIACLLWPICAIYYISKEISGD